MLRFLTILGILMLFAACNEHTVRKQGFGVHGIDVSHYQKEIDWEKVANQDIQFAFVKATEGEFFRDSFFCENWAAMKSSKIKRGAYHFFRPSISSEAQAVNFIETAELGNGDFAPVLDVEVLDGVTDVELRREMRKWLEYVEGYYKIKPIIYTYQKFFNQNLAGHFQDYPIWIARYSSWRSPSLCGPFQKWTFWQYGNKGRLEGIDGPVDFNVFSGDEKELEAHCLIWPKPLLDQQPESPEEVASANP